MRGFWAIVVAWLAGGAIGHPAAETGRYAQDGDRAIYAAVLRDAFEGRPPTNLLVVAEVLVPERMEERDFRNHFPEAPRQLWERFDDVVRLVSEERLDASVMPDGTRFVSQRELSLDLDPVDPGAGWRAFYQQWGTTNRQTFSRPIVGDDRRDAIVYHEFHCGFLCAEGALVWLHRGPVNGTWTVRRRVRLWVS